MSVTDLAMTGHARRGLELTRRCLSQIERYDPLVNAVLALDPTALEQAARAERRRDRAPLAGIPVLVKDNIDVAGLDCTAGSRLLIGAAPAQDAPVVARLRVVGAVVLGKTNLSEWGNFRSYDAPEGWSAVGGQTRNAHAPQRSPWGSSAGSAVAVAAGMAPLALGTETDGSIVCPAGANGVVGVKPEPGLLPSGGVVPIAPAQDSVGVFATRLSDAVLCLAELTNRTDLSAAPARLAGRRFGLWHTPGIPRLALRAVSSALRAAGAELVEVHFPEHSGLMLAEVIAMQAEFPEAVANYLRTRPGVPDSLDGLIAANRADPEELRLFDQGVFEASASLSAENRALRVEAGRQARARARRLLDDALRRVDAVLAPTNPPAWRLEPGRPDPRPATSSVLAALAGYPNVSIPAAEYGGLPLGVSVFGPPKLAALLPLAGAVEQFCPPYRAAAFTRHMP
ncbi:amidase family protein [Streptomyces fulvorobeus]|uniref:Amidase n=1 Tax=Streptomyces fulvorobeus TaxID=284028 RepID=A0A7Y9KTT7_9ACTN|nr:amidase family protein [Streptomyces fulvorobeus]NYE39014.1 amidase [Streptomyces fulvorobeus]